MHEIESKLINLFTLVILPIVTDLPKEYLYLYQTSSLVFPHKLPKPDRL